MKKSRPSDVLFTKTQRRVLGLLFGNPDRSYYANEIVRFAGAGIGAVQRELARLAAAGLVTATKRGNQKHYQAERQSGVFAELSGLVKKTVGGEAPALAAREAGAAYRGRSQSRGRRALEISYPKLRELCRRYHVKKLSLFGSAARGELKPESDVDLMIEFEPGRAPSLWGDAEITGDFSALFGGRRVDIVPPGVMRNPYRRKSIERDIKVLYEAE
ncbi:MAG TPA: nucleotidyltransferase domain-containing protein [Burkholderiales bacterium]